MHEIERPSSVYLGLDQDRVFEKGKAGIMVQTKEKLPAVIDTPIAAVRAGELDEHLNQAAKTRAVGKVKKAA